MSRASHDRAKLSNRSLHTGFRIGRPADVSTAPLKATLRPSAYCKCQKCGSTLMTFLDAQLHYSRTGECLSKRAAWDANEFNAVFSG